ncbi:hypothetical protein MASR1M65_29150 [Saprospiraceae bacterium]
MSDNKPLKSRSSAQVVLQYSGMAFEMLVIILVGWFIGKTADEFFKFSKPVFAIIFILIFTMYSLYRIIKSLEKLNK